MIKGERTLGLSIVRFEKNNEVQWGVLIGAEIIPLKRNDNSLQQLLKSGISALRKVTETNKNSARYSFEEVHLLSPVTRPAQIICQGANYASHRAEAGLESARPPYNMIFGKSDSSLCGALSNIVRPPHVKLLDYEIELGLVLGKNITGPVEISDENLHEYIAGLVLTNDVSARDVQLPQGQWLKGKSYRTFCPAGPVIYLLDEGEMSKIHDLELNLWVNEELRQSVNTSLMLYKPAETLTELSEVMDLSIGDLILTGTTGGVALQLTSDVMNEILNPFVDGNKKMQLLLDSQQNNTKYLKDGDIIRCQIQSSDGSISLGEQRNQVVASCSKT